MFNDNLHGEIGDGLIGECKLGEGYLVNRKSGICTVSRSGTLMRLFVECVTEDFYDTFNSVKVSDSVKEYENTIKRGIELVCDSPIADPFILLSTDLIRFVEDSDNRPNLQNWCDDWKEIIGNKYSEQLVYDTLAELIVYGHLMDEGCNPDWSGPDGSRHDIHCDGFDCEVKSTIRRTGALTIQTGELQLLPGTKPLYLYVSRFEHSPNGDFCIAGLREDLVRKGADRNELDAMLKKTGLNTTGNMNKRFNLLHPINVYRVDDEFPRIADSDFIGGKRPSHIMNLAYSISLEGLDCDKILVEHKDGKICYTPVIA